MNHVDGDTGSLRDVAPARAGEFGDFVDDLLDVHFDQGFGFGTPPVKFAHAGDDLGDVLRRAVDDLQVFP